jgi:phage protein D
MPSHIWHFHVKLNGMALPEKTLRVLDITVENSLHLPDAATLHIHDNDLEWLNKHDFKPGAEIEVMAGQESESGSTSVAYQSIFHGEVTGLDVDMDSSSSSTLTAHCMDQSHRMQRGRKSKTFQQQTDSDIVTKVIQGAGLIPGIIEATSVVHDWVMQNNLTDWEFVQERAKHAGYRLFVEGKNKVNFVSVDHKGSEVTLKWGDDLFSFHPRVTASQQVDQVQVQGWDRKQKQQIVGTSSSPNGIPQNGFGGNGGQTAQSGFGGSAKMVVVDRPVFSQTEAEKVAQSVHDDIGGHFIEADGICAGNPALKPETIVKIENLGTKYNGTYQLSTTTHILKPSVYKTHFTISGKRDTSLHSILKGGGGGGDTGAGTAGGGGGSNSSRISGVAVGIVTDNNDPDKLGRVKVKLPWLSNDDTSDWAAQAAPMTGNGRGFYYLPEIDDEVLVGFELGDVRRPYILGGLWNGKDTPVEGNDVAVTGGKVNHRIIKTRIGHTVLLDDTDSKGEMKMTTSSGHYLTLSDKDQKIEAKTKNGHILTMDDQNKKIVIKTTGGHTITMDDQGNKIEIKDSSGNEKITMDANQSSISIEAALNLSIKATQISIEGQATVDIKSPMTSVNGDGTLTLKGGIVQIN